MGMIELNRKRAAVIGLGQSGLAMARWLARSGSDVLVFDDRAQPPGLDALHAQVPGATFHSRTLDAGVLDAAGQIDLLAWSPGVSCETGAGAALHAAARERGIPVHGELDFFMDAIATLRAQGAKTDVVAITGTNGKTTVTRLCAFLANEAGLEAVAAGNISPSMLDALMDRLGDLPIEPVPAPLQESAPEDESAPESPPPSAAAAAMPRLWALELSSFQLAVSQPPACQAAVVLNVTPDHLDWHGSMENYRAAKLRIYPAAERRVVNLDDPLADPDLPAPWEVPAEPEAPQPAKGRSRAKAKVEVPVLAPRTDFSLHPPHSAPAFGLVREGGLAWLTEALPEEVPGGRRRKAEPVDFVLNRLMPADALRVQGAHNHANVLAALALLRERLWPSGEAAASRSAMERARALPAAFWGMLVAHVGVGVFIIGVAGVNTLETEADEALAPGQSMSLGGYEFRLQELREVPGPNYQAVQAKVEVSRDGRFHSMLLPEKRAYSGAMGTTQTEAAIETRLTGDVYVALGERLPDGRWTMLVWIKPFVDWIWGGCVLMALGGFIAMADRRYRRQRARGRQD